MTTYHLTPTHHFSGTFRVPGDKSISHRAVMLASLAEGISEITGFLTGEDCLCTMKAFQAMGVQIERLADTHLRIHGVGLHGLKAPAHALDVGNSGTSMRLMSGLLAAQAFASTLIGDSSLSKRPMRRITDPLAAMGASIDTQDGKAPLYFSPTQGLKAIQHVSKVASAQVKSGILLAGLYAQGTTSVTEPEASRDHTERMLQAFGVDIEARDGYAAITGGQRLQAANIQVPADISSATFLMLAAALVPNSDVLLVDVGINPTRTGVIDILQSMGAHIALENPRTFGGEPVADIRVQGRALKGIHVDEALVASAIDEFPAIFIAAACAEGTTLVTGAEELRVKESDRIASMIHGLQALGVTCEAHPDGATIVGQPRLGVGRANVTIDTHGDHRIAMSFAVASLRTDSHLTLLDCENVNTSFPGFAELVQQGGLNLRVQSS